MGTWALIVTGVFSGAVQGPTTQWDFSTLKTLTEMSGDITMSKTGYPTKADCEIQQAASLHELFFTFNGLTITVKSIECRDTEAKITEGRGPRS